MNTAKDTEKMRDILIPMAAYVQNSGFRCSDDVWAPEPAIRIISETKHDTGINLEYDERDEFLATVERYQREADIGFETAFLAAAKPYVESLA